MNRQKQSFHIRPDVNWEKLSEISMRGLRARMSVKELSQKFGLETTVKWRECQP